MKRLLQALPLLLAWAALFRPDTALGQATAAFSCDGTFYQIRQVGSTSSLYRVDRSSSTYTTVAVNVANGSNDLGTLLNGLAYNPQDGFMYALTTTGTSNTLPTSISLYKIGTNGVTNLGTVSGMPNIQIASGTFDKTGHYYVSSQNTNGTADYKLYRFDLNSTTPLAATALSFRNEGNTANENDTFYDIAYNPQDNYLYGVRNTGQLWRIDQTTYANASQAPVKAIQATASSGSSAIGTAFFDVAGTLYAYSNGNVNNANSGAFYQVNLSSGVFTQISNIDPASVSDGASCINPGNAIDVTKELTNVKAVNAYTFDLSYTIRVRNTYTITDPNVQVSDILTGSTTNSTFPTATAVSIVTAPAVTNLDGSTLVANSAFTGQSAIPSGSLVSGASLLDGTQSLTAGQRAVITYTVRVQFGTAASSVPTTAQNNTAYATSSAASPNKGYMLNSNGTLLSPNDLLANDASSNSAAFPALRSSSATYGTPDAVDTPSATPVTFAPSIAGVVFEDVNYGGGLGRSQGTSNGLGRSGARVELYTVNNVGLATYSTTTTTAADGSYSFTGLTAGARYVVRVVSSTVTSSRNTGGATGLVGVQTFRTSVDATNGTQADLNRVGGEFPGRTEAANGANGTTLTTLNASTTTGAESIANVVLPSSNAPAVDVSFGYNFDTVVNTNDAGQGSLRQFIANANALDNTNLDQDQASSGGFNPAAGVETSIFMISDGRAHDGLTAYNATSNPGLISQLTGSNNGVGGTVATITPSTALPALGGTYSAYTTIDGTTQTQNVGNTNNVTLGTGGTVGTAKTALGQLNGPEVQLTGSTNVAIGLDVAASATNTTIRGLAVLGFGNSRDNDAAANIRSAANNFLLTRNVLGSVATAFTQPNTPTNADNVRLIAGTTGISITNNLIGYANSKGVDIDPNVTNVLVSGNELRSNGLASSDYDNVDVQGSNATISNNLLTSALGQGIDSYRSPGGNTIVGNTVTDNGRGGSTLAPNETPGMRIYGAGNALRQNLIFDNYGAGVLLEGATGNGSVAAVGTTVISQNSIYNNGNVTARNNNAATGEVGIDLAATGDSETKGTSPYVTLNSSNTAGANGLLNYPVLSSATVVGSNLLVQGYSKAGAAIELFIAQANPSSVNATGANFGQGKTYLTTVTEGSTLDTNPLTGQSYSGAINGFNQGSDTNANGFSFLIPLSTLPSGTLTNGTLATGTLLTSTATLSNATSEFSGNVTTTTTAPLTGYVYEDVNYGGGLGRSRSAAGSSAVTRPGAKVELYNASGAYVSTAITDATGQYSFSVVPGSYTVRVVNNSVLSSRAGATAASGSATTGYASDQLPVQTYNGTTTRVGGENPAYTDADANTGSQTLAALSNGTTTPESIATTTVAQGASSNAGPDFGYNFDTVVNTNDAGQGSLRQFVANANALGGESSLAQAGSNTAGTLPTGKETSIFMIPDGAAHPGLLAGSNGGPASQLTNGVAAITLGSSLTLAGANATSTIIDGTTQTQNVGNTNNVTLGTGGTVGTAKTALGQLNGPEVQLKGDRSFDAVAISANTSTVRGLSVYGFSNDIYVDADVTNALIEQNVLGTPATSFTDPGANVRTLNQGINLNNSDNGIIRNNLIAYNGGMGIWVLGDGNGSNNNTISGNEIRGNAQETQANGEGLVFDGLELQGASTGNAVTGNLITANLGHGIDSYANTGTGGNTVTGNTISNNGQGVATGTGQEGSGLRVYSSTNTTVIANNVLTGNNGSGVLVESAASKVTISQNSTSGNTRLGIDLLSNTDANTDANTYNGYTGTTTNVTLNSSDTGGANGLLNYPVITSAVVAGGNLLVQGYAKAGAAIELFVAQPNASTAASPNNLFGQGATYLTTVTEGSSSDANTQTGQSYSGTINGFNQGSDTNANGFSFSIPLSSLPSGALTGGTLPAGSLLTSTATLSNATSEFSGNARVQQPPVPNDVTNVSVPDNTTTPVVLNPNLSGTALGYTTDVTTTTANSIVSYTVSLPSSGTLYYNNTALTAATVIPASNLGALSFKPVYGSTNTVTFTYTALDANGQPSTTHNTNGTSSSGPATYTIPVSASADVTASLTGGTTLAAGLPTGTYTATFTNVGPDAASGVTQSVTLPAGATLTSAQRTAITNAYTTNTTFTTSSSGQVVITFPPASSLASGAANSYRFAFTAPATTGSSTLVATAGTSSSQGTNTAPDTAPLTLNTTAVTDVQASIAASAATVAPGATATFTATFTNGTSNQPAAGVVPAVQLIPGLTTATLTVGGQTGTLAGTTITFSNSGATYSTTTGQLTYPSTTLVGGASTSSVIAFTMPANGIVTGTASVSTTTPETNTTNNVASASITAGPQFDLATTLYGPSAVVAGSPVTLNVTTTNNGPQAVSGAVETVQLPAGLNSTGTPNVFISNGGTYNNSNGVVTFPALGALPSGQTVANTITFLAPTSAFAPSATVTPNTTATGDRVPGNNTAYLNGATSSTSLTPGAATTNQANVYAILSTTSTIVSAGTQVTYSAGIGNAGPSTATTVLGWMQVIPGLTTSTITVAGQAGTLQADGVTIKFPSNTTYNTTTGLITYAALPSLASGASNTANVVITVPATVGNNGQLLATVSVGSATSDAVPADNVKAVAITVLPTTDVATTILGPTSGVVAGQSVTYTATFSNNGPDAANTTAETVQLPAGLSSVTVKDASGTTITGANYSSASGLVTLPAITSDAVGAVQTYSLTFAAPAQSYVVSSAVSSATTDNVLSNNAASVATTVAPTADVAVAVTGPAITVAGNQITYAVTLTNNGPSPATGVVATLQLPAGLSGFADGPNGSSNDYNTTSGLVTLPTVASIPAGSSVVRYLSFTMPSTLANNQLTATAAIASTTSTDNVAANNTAAVTTTLAPATTTSTDLSAGITLNNGITSPVVAGSTVSATFKFQNTSSTSSASYVLPVANLPTGISVSDLTVAGATGTLSNGLITFSNGSAYDPATGALTFPTSASLGTGQQLSYAVTFPAPANTPLLLSSEVSLANSDPGVQANRATTQLAVTPAFDLTTSLSGPTAALAGTPGVYTVTTTNAGPSAAAASQTVTLPSGLGTSALLVAGQTGTLSGSTITYSNTGATYNTGTGVLTFPTVSSLAKGSVTNTFTVTMPSSGTLSLSAGVTTTTSGETNTTNNTTTFSTQTSPLSFAPTAENIVNSLQSVRGNTSTTNLPISPLYATDPDDGIATTNGYAITSLPTSGTLYYNGTAISSIPTNGYAVTDRTLLSYKPASGFVGNAFFTYTATDKSGVVSNTALYTIPVAQDQNTTYTATPTKGGTNKYATNDVLAYVIDPNTAIYNSSNLVYGTGNGTTASGSSPLLQSGARNGLPTSGTNATLASSGNGPAASGSYPANSVNTLPSGMALDPVTGLIYVSDASQLPKVTTKTYYQVNVITTDLNGGINTTTAQFALGAYPLPVELTAFAAQAVQNRDALLTWTTASELHNDHFEVERSLDGTTFSQVGQVAGQGSKASRTDYRFTDAGAGLKVAAGQPVYYRLRQVDADGTSAYSPVRTISFSAGASAAVTLFPNPATTATSLDLSALPTTGTYQVLLLDMAGRQVAKAILTGGLVQSLDVHELASGTYQVLVTGQQADGSALRQVLRLTKE